jgi:ParB-like chromosome segregation protein Spo0J
MTAWEAGTLRPVPVALLGESYRRYRLPDAEGETAMACSLKRYGQLAPIVVCLRDDVPEVLDGFKRLAAARTWPKPATLSARLLAADERTAKAAIYGLNRTGRHIQELEEAWIVQALVREDGLSQVEAAELLGRHKSWVCRRLALLERLAEEARADLRLGLLPPTAARALVQLPAGNQVEVLAVARRERLSTAELRGVVELLGAAAGVRPHDPRLSAAGNRVARQLGQVIEQLTRMDSWLRYRGRAELSRCDRGLLAASFVRLARDAGAVAALAADLGEELQTP